MPQGTLDPALMIRLQQLAAQREREKVPGYPMSALSKATAISAEPPIPVQPGKTRAESDRFFDQLLNMGMSGGAGVTNFASKAERELASKATLNSLYTWLVEEGGWHPNDAIKAVNAAAKYPRVAAHIDPAIKTIEPNFGTRGQLDWPANQPPESSISELGLARRPGWQTPATNVTNTVLHEMTHQAQKLGSGGNQQFRSDYLGAGSQGYWDNPYEISARSAAELRAPSPGVPADYRLFPELNQLLIDKLFKRK